MGSSITGVSSMATRQLLGELAGRYETQNRCSVTITPMGGVEAARRVRGGEAIDIVVLASTVMAALEGEGHVRAGSSIAIALSGAAVAVPAGAPHPPIADEAALRAAMLAAGRIAYSTGPSGKHLLALCERWGLLPDEAGRLVEAPPGVPVGELLAQGRAALGVQQLSELLPVAGIEIVGPLPPGVQSTTTFAAGIAATSRQPGEAERLIAFLAAPESAATKRKHGMEPA